MVWAWASARHNRALPGEHNTMHMPTCVASRRRQVSSLVSGSSALCVNPSLRGGQPGSTGPWFLCMIHTHLQAELDTYPGLHPPVPVSQPSRPAMPLPLSVCCLRWLGAGWSCWACASITTAGEGAQAGAPGGEGAPGVREYPAAALPLGAMSGERARARGVGGPRRRGADGAPGLAPLGASTSQCPAFGESVSSRGSPWVMGRASLPTGFPAPSFPSG